MKAIESTAIDPPKGSGLRPFIEGDPITSPTQVTVGDLLCEYSIQFNTCNLVRVTRTEFEVANTQHVYGMFVDPQHTAKPRMGSTGDMSFWDWEINPVNEDRSGDNRHRPSATVCKVLHRAVIPTGPVRRLELRANDGNTAVEATDTPEGRKMLEWFASRNGHRFMIEGENPVFRITTVQHNRAQLCPLMVEHLTL